MSRPLRAITHAWLLVLCAGCAAPHVSGPSDDQVRSILFLGNSLTYYNDLPAMVAQAAHAAGVNLRIGSVALPNVGVIDHADGLTPARAAIAAERWDLVVLQQGPTPEGICRDTLVLGAERLAALARASGARVAMLSTWTRITVPDFLPEARRSNVLAADAAGGSVFFVGDAWRVAQEQRGNLPLYDGDGYHPAVAGSWLAALVIVEQLFDPPDGWITPTPTGVASSAVSVLRLAARHAAEESDSLRQVVPPPRATPYPGPC